MSINNTKDGSNTPWKLDLRTNGRNSKRIRKTFATRGEALAYESYILKKSNRNHGWVKQSTTVNYLN